MFVGKAIQSLSAKAMSLGMTPQDFLTLKIIYAQFDMSAYTGGAKYPALELYGLPVMDHYFKRHSGAIGEFVWSSEYGRLLYSDVCEPMVQELYLGLAA